MNKQEKTKDISIYLSRLNSLMSGNSLSQSELARVTGIKQATISDYTKGNSIPSAERFSLISSALGVSMDYLWGTSDDNPNEEKTTPTASADWKTRAQAAEKKLNQLKGLMNGLGSDVESLGTTVSKLTKFITE